MKNLFDDNLTEILRQKYEKYGARIVKHLQKKENEYLIAYILKATPKLDNSYTFGTRIYWILNGLVDFPQCKNCGKPLEHINVCIKTGYIQQYCSYKCLNTSNEKKDKVKKTCLKKYGVENPYSSNEIKEKIKRTCLDKYGVDSFTKTEISKNKHKQTSLQKYGTEHPMQSDIVKKHISETNLKKYGEKNVYQTQWCKDKIRNTLTEKYGSDHPMHIDEIKKKVILKQKERFLNHISKPNNYVEFLGFDGNFYNWKCKVCSNVFKSENLFYNFYIDGQHIYGRCEKCYPLQINKSTKENYIANTLHLILKDLEIRQNVRNIIPPQELDIYIPEKKLAIEFDGLYWHSTATAALKNFSDKKLKLYHLNKTKACLEKGIQLIHIFEDELQFKRDIVISRLKTICGNTKRIFARQCEIQEIQQNDAADFLLANHIQGIVNSKVNIALKHNGIIVALMTFGKPRYNKKYEWELLRFCNALNTTVIGGASKLLSYFERNYNPKSLVSYADRRWSQGNLYYKLGFSFLKETPPNYFYVNGINRYSRIKFQKHKLKALFENFDNNLTEMENMKNNGYDVIFDCGNLVFEKKYL